VLDVSSAGRGGSEIRALSIVTDWAFYDQSMDALFFALFRSHGDLD
jgi:hypothetical protein